MSEGEHNAELDQLKTFLNEECKMYDKYITVKKHDYQTYVDMMRAFSERWEADSPFKLKQNQSQNSYEWEKPKKTHSCLQRLSTIKENPQTSFKNINSTHTMI